MPVVFNPLRQLVQYRQCIMADIGRHFEIIKHWIPDHEWTSFQERMADCIEEEHAWCTANTFLYYQIDDKGIGYGVAIFGQNYALELLALFIGIFWQEDKKTHVLRFKLHPGKQISEYKTMLTPISVKRAYQDPNHPVAVRIDHFRKKISKIYTAWTKR